MSAKNSHTTADYIPWEVAINLVRRLYKDGDYRMSAFIATGIFTGLRVSDLRMLRWNDLMGGDKLVVIEKKTKKRREIRLNHDFQAHIRDCYHALEIFNPNEYVFLSQKRVVFSVQRLNVKLKEIKARYRIKVDNFSCHSLRKSLGREVFNKASDSGKEMSLLMLSELYGHSSVQITKRYLGLKQEEILATYDLLSF